MKKILSVLSVLLILASCGGGYNPPNNPGGGNVVVNPIASFEYYKEQPLTVYFNNTSKKADSYIWDFGDGTTSDEVNPIHKYKSKGVYKVLMTAYRGSKSDQCYANITITEPTKCYVTGVVYEKVPNNNEYYNVRFTDDYMFFETLYWSTNWVILSSANLPYTYTFTKKREIDLSLTKYMMRLYKNSDTSGKGTQVASWSVSTSNLKSKFPTKTTGISDNASVTLLLQWED